MVDWWTRMRTTPTRCRAALACRCPLRFSLCRLVFPLEAGTGQAPWSLAEAASERIRSGSSPARTSISAAVPDPTPCAATISGAHRSASRPRWTSCALISASRSSQRRAMARRLALAERPSCGSSGFPCGFALENGVEDAEEAPEAGDDGDLFRSTSRGHLLVVGLDDGVPVDGGEGGHVEEIAHGRPAAGDGPVAAHLSTIAGDRGDADEGGET